ncbi:hypothetical protein chiPu_0019888 [Chiloscyllium punctatum]|uniref:Tripartite motif-containing protein 65 n=1 Tax=Chiloscyllium punctatum TaxID=137246 RepID=A0A401RTG1_CHIPU|nr:hypothetical protein [Chiloscyllium punctatum]
MSATDCQELEEKLLCAICLDMFSEPVTISCGHTFCLRCLRAHWDRQSPAGPFDCPNCRKLFPQRPEPLARNLLLEDMVNYLRVRSPETPLSPAAESGSCPHHRRALELYCSTDRQCICSVCTTGKHKGHDLITVEDARLQREKELMAKHEEVRRQVKKTEELIDTLKQQKISVKDCASRAQKNYGNKFAMLRKELEQVQDKVLRYIENEEQLAVEQADSALEKLERRSADLSEISLKLVTTLKSNDSLQILQFPQEIHSLNKTQQDIVLPPSDLAIENKLQGVKRALEQISILTFEDLQDCFRPPPKSLDVSESVSTDKHDPVKPLKSQPLRANLHIREPFLQSYCQLSFDVNTAHRFLSLSKGGRRVSHKETQTYPVHTERFEKDWQVMCRESFNSGQHYWEVLISSQWVYLGVTYRRISRRDASALIGRNSVSWALQLFNKSYSAWHDNQEVKLQPATYSRIGIHLDYTAGILRFYGITDTMTLIHTFQSVFTEPLYPVIWVGENVVATLCQPPLR